jgi:hypothetical protein
MRPFSKLVPISRRMPVGSTITGIAVGDRSSVVARESSAMYSIHSCSSTVQQPRRFDPAEANRHIPAELRQ